MNNKNQVFSIINKIYPTLHKIIAILNLLITCCFFLNIVFTKNADFQPIFLSFFILFLCPTLTYFGLWELDYYYKWKFITNLFLDLIVWLAYFIAGGILFELVMYVEKDINLLD